MKKLTISQFQYFSNAADCFICGEKLGCDRVKDHCHLTGDFRGPAHSKCNMQYEVHKFIPVVLHNLRGYDSHFIVRATQARSTTTLDQFRQRKLVERLTRGCKGIAVIREVVESESGESV